MAILDIPEYLCKGVPKSVVRMQKGKRGIIFFVYGGEVRKFRRQGYFFTAVLYPGIIDIHKSFRKGFMHGLPDVEEPRGSLLAGL